MLLAAATFANRSYLRDFVVSHLHCDGADASTSFPDPKRTWTAQGNAQVDTAQSKFGGASALFDGSGDWLKTPNSNDFQFGTGNFDIRAFVRLASTAAIQNLIAWSTASGPVQVVATDGGGKTGIYGQTGWVIQNSCSISTSTWTALQWQRNGNSWKVAKDGVQQGSTVTDSRSLGSPNHANTIGIGAEVTGPSQYTNGHYDEIVILKGACFDNLDVPTMPFPDF